MCYAWLCFVINHKALGCVAPQKEEKTRKAVCSESADKKRLEKGPVVVRRRRGGEGEGGREVGGGGEGGGG